MNPISICQKCKYFEASSLDNDYSKEVYNLALFCMVPVDYSGKDEMDWDKHYEEKIIAKFKRPAQWHDSFPSRSDLVDWLRKPDSVKDIEPKKEFHIPEGCPYYLEHLMQEQKPV